MNETIEVIRRRYSCRAFTGEPPGDEPLRAVAEAALAAPSAMNRQLWRVIVVKDRALIADMEAEGLRRLAAEPDQSAFERIQSRGGRLFYNAPCLLVIPVDRREYGDSAVFDCGIITQTVALAAASLGIDSCICGLAGQAFAGERAEEFRRRLGFPEGFTHGMTVLLGYAQTAGGTPHAADISKLTFID